MSYTKQTFVNNQTVLTAEMMDHIEVGIVENENKISQLSEEKVNKPTSGNGTAGQYLTSDGNGGTTWVTAEGGGSGCISVKKIVFTDRPTLWNWLQANYAKISNVKLWSNVSQCVDDMIFIGHRKIAEGENVPSRFSFYTIYPQNSATDLYITTSRVEVYEDRCVLDIYTQHNVVKDTTEKEGQSQIVPDAYWSAMGIEVTIYYFDE